MKVLGLSELNYKKPSQCRLIPRKYGSYRGTIRSTKNHLKNHSFDHESGLERDLLIILDHDYFCYDIQVQPSLNGDNTSFVWTDSFGKTHKTTPDIWTIFRTGKQIIWQVKPLKFLTNLEKEKNSKKKMLWEEEVSNLENKCKKMGWEFRLVTESIIRTPRLININLLRGSALQPPKKEIIEKFLNIIPDDLEQTGKTFTELQGFFKLRKSGLKIETIQHIIRYLLYYQTLTFDWNSILKKETILYSNIHSELLIEPIYNITQKSNANPSSDIAPVSLPSPNKIKHAYNKYNIIEDLLKHPNRKRKDIETRAKEKNVSSASIYRWINQFLEEGINGLIDNKKFRGNNSSRFPFEIENIITDCIDEWLKNKKRTNQTSLTNIINQQIINSGYTEYNVSYSMVVKRIKKLDAKERLGKQGGFIRFEVPSINLGELPTGNYPLDSIQFDHTLIDISLVDQVYRLPVGRPYLTIGIDTYSRMIYCYNLSFYNPNSLSVTSALMQGILPKGKILKRFDINVDYPIYGIPRRISVDNAKEFDSKHLENFCSTYNIDVQFREVKRPDHGAYVERFFRTLKEAIRNSEIKGFAHPLPERPIEYNPDIEAKKGGLTLLEFEEWLLTWITKIYHQKVHYTLKKSPLDQYYYGIMGFGQSFGINPVISNPEMMKFHIMPISQRKHVVHPSGIKWNGNWYNAKILLNIRRRNRGSKKNLSFRYDPRNITHIWIFDEFSKHFHPLFITKGFLAKYVKENPNKPVELSEYLIVKKKIRNVPNKINSRIIASGIEELRELEKIGAKRTKKARRKQAKRKESSKTPKINGKLKKKEKITEKEEVETSEFPTAFKDAKKHMIYFTDVLEED